MTVLYDKKHKLVMRFSLVIVCIIILCACERYNGLSPQAFPPDLNPIKFITFIGYDAYYAERMFTVEQADEYMVWSSDEFHALEHHFRGYPQVPYITLPRFKSPNEYLFDAILRTLFLEREFEWTKDSFSDDEIELNIKMYNVKGDELFSFDLAYMNRIRYNGQYYTTSPDIEWEPFYVAAFLACWKH